MLAVRRRWLVVGAIALVVAIAVVGVVAYPRDHSTTGRLAGWLDDHCTSVERDHVATIADPDLPRRGVVGADVLTCEMLGGQVDVLRYGSPAQRRAALATRRLAPRTACAVGARDLVIDQLLAEHHLRDFAEWCGKLDGRLV